MKNIRRTGLIMGLKPANLKNVRFQNLLSGLMAAFYNGEFRDYTILCACHKLNLTLPSADNQLKDYLVAYCCDVSPMARINFLKLLRFWRDQGLDFEVRLLFGISLAQLIDIYTDLIVDDYQKLAEANPSSPSLSILRSQLSAIFQKTFSKLCSENLSPDEVLQLNDILIGITRALAGKNTFRQNQREAA
jgi:hypothetical protein